MLRRCRRAARTARPLEHLVAAISSPGGELIAALVSRASRSDGSFDAPVRGEGVERPALWHGSDPVPHPFWASFQMKRGTRPPSSATLTIAFDGGLAEPKATVLG